MLQAGSARADTGVRSMQDAFRYISSLPSQEVPPAWLTYLQGMKTIVVADLSDADARDLPQNATELLPSVKAFFNFLTAANDGVGIMVSCTHCGEHVVPCLNSKNQDLAFLNCFCHWGLNFLKPHNPANYVDFEHMFKFIIIK